MAKESLIMEYSTILFILFGNRVNSLEDIRDVLIETMRTEKVNLDTAFDIVKCKLKAQQYLMDEEIFA